jgi:hypothetical protein
MIGGLNTAALASVVSLDNEVLDWYTAVKNDGGDANSNTLNALDEFMITLKKNGIRNKIKRCNLFCGANLRSCLHPLIRGRVGESIGSKKDISYGFVNSDYSFFRGLSAESLSSSVLLSSAQKFLHTNTFLTSLGLDNYGGHISFMSYNDTMNLSSVGGYMMPLFGGDYSVKNDLSAYIEFDQDSTKAASPSSFNPSSTRGYVNLDTLDDDVDVSGFWLANRTSKTNQKLYNNGMAVEDSDATLSQDGFPIGGYKFRIFSAFSAGQETQASISKILFYSIGEKLAETDIKILNNALAKFNEVLGRN